MQYFNCQCNFDLFLEARYSIRFQKKEWHTKFSWSTLYVAFSSVNLVSVNAGSNTDITFQEKYIR